MKSDLYLYMYRNTKRWVLCASYAQKLGTNIHSGSCGLVRTDIQYVLIVWQ